MGRTSDFPAGIEAREQKLEIQHAALRTEIGHHARHDEPLTTGDERDVVRDAVVGRREWKEEAEL